MLRLLTSSVVLLVVLFCQITIFWLAPDAHGATRSTLDTPTNNQTKQLSILGANLPVLVESKHPDPLARGKQSECGPFGISHSTARPIFAKLQFSERELGSIAPAPTRYWLIYRALLL